MFFTSLPTIHSSSFLNLSLLLHIVPNLWKISSSDCRAGLANGRSWSHGYHLTTARVYSLSVDLATYPAQENLFFWHSTITYFTHFRSWITSFRMCSRINISIIDLSMALRSNQSLFFLLCGSPCFIFHIGSQSKQCNWRCVHNEGKITYLSLSLSLSLSHRKKVAF